MRLPVRPLTLALALASPALAAPLDIAVANGRVTAHLANAPAARVLEELAARAGMTMEGPVDPAWRVTADIQDRPLERALDRVLGHTGFILVYDGGAPRRLVVLPKGVPLARASASPRPGQPAADASAAPPSAEEAAAAAAAEELERREAAVAELRKRYEEEADAILDVEGLTEAETQARLKALQDRLGYHP